MFRSLRRIVIASACLAAAAAPALANVVVVLNSRDATVQLLDQSTFQSVSTFAVGKEPHHLMATPDNKSLIVASAVGKELIFLDPKSGQIQRHIKDVLGPDSMEITADGKTMWVTLRWIKKVAVIDLPSRKIVKMIPVGRSPHGVYFANAAARN